jgi:putative MATE family efflux protein
LRLLIEKMDKTRELGEAKIGPLMFKYYIPAFIGVVANTLYNIVDRVFIGRGVGAEALSGVSVIFPIMLIMMGFGMLIGIGAGVMISINLGRKNKQRADQILGTGFVMMLIVSAFITLIGFALKKPILHSFGATDEIFNYANDYLNIILWGAVFQVVGFSLNNIIRSEGNAKIAMVSMLLSAGINVILNPVFIFGLGWGVKGSALATVISQIILDIWVIAHFMSSRSVVKLKKEYIKVDPSILKEIVAIGMAPFAMQIAGSFVQGLLNTKLITYGGDLAVGAMGIINSVVTMVVMIIVAINMASQPIIGFNYGARKTERVKEAFKKAIAGATAIAVVSFVLIELFAVNLVNMFNTSSPELAQIAVPGLKIFVLGLPVVGFQIVTGNYFQSVGKAKIAMMLTLLRQVLVLLPLLLVFSNWWRLKGIWIAPPVADIVSSFIVAFFLIREWRKLKRIQQPEIVSI